MATTVLESKKLHFTQKVTMSYFLSVTNLIVNETSLYADFVVIAMIAAIINELF